MESLRNRLDVKLENNRKDYLKCASKPSYMLLFTDTDSLRCEIKTEDVYEDFSSDKEIFDFSNYWTKSKYCFNCNKFVIGKTKGIEIEEALRLLNLFD